MAFQARDYDPRSNIVTVGAVPITEGYAEGTFIRVARTTPSFSSKAGSYGDVEWIRSHDKRGTVELTVLRTAAINSYLSSLLILGETTGTGIVPVTIEDINGETKVFAAEARVTRPADVEEAVESSTRVWLLECAVLEMYIGGNIAGV